MTKYLNISTDTTLGGLSPSDEVVSSQKALKTYIDAQSGATDMTGATASTAGTHGLVPAPAAGDQDKVLHGDGTWKVGVGIHPDLFDHKWADYELSDMNWLRADTFSWQDGGVYQAAYNHLSNEYTNISTESRHYIKLYLVDPDTKYYRDSSKDVTGEAHPYAYTSFLSSTVSTIYTSNNPEDQYAYDGSTSSATALGKYASSSQPDSIRVPQTETIAGTTIAYYLAADGHKIVLPEQESNVNTVYAATGVAWYYIIDTVNERFKLPRTKYGFNGLRDTVGNYIAPGLPNITGTATLIASTSGATSGTGAMAGSSNSGTSNFGASNSPDNNAVIRFDASQSNSIYGNSTTVQPPATQMYLYFYVGEFTQTALENTAGLNASLFNGKADLDFGNTSMIDYIVEKQDPTAGNNYTWYKKYKSGWVEQGGQETKTLSSLGSGSTATFATVTFSVPITKIIKMSFGDNMTFYNVHARDESGTGMTIKVSNQLAVSSTEGTRTIWWTVSGMAA